MKYESQRENESGMSKRNRKTEQCVKLFSVILRVKNPMKLYIKSRMYVIRSILKGQTVSLTLHGWMIIIDQRL